MEVTAFIKILLYATFLLVPAGLESIAIVAYLVIYVFQMVYLLREDSRSQKGKYSIVNFNVFFFSMYTFCTYLIPVYHLIGFNDYSIYTLMIYFNVSYIPKALFLSSVAIEVYTLFYLKGLRKKVYEQKIIPLPLLKQAQVVSSIPALISVAFFYLDFVKSRNAGLVDVGGHSTALVTCFTILPVLLHGYANKYYYHSSLGKFLTKSWFSLLCQFFVILSMISIGDRLIAVCLLSTIAIIINEYVFKIKTIFFLGAMVLAFVGLFLIGFTRGKDTSYSEGLATYNSSSDRFLIFQDVYPANATLLMGTEVVEKQGFYKPFRIIPYVLNPIPFVPSYLQNTFFDGEIASAMYLTKYNRKLNTVGDSGIGTHVVADLYLSWGILGVVVMFGLLGYIVGLSYRRRENVFYMIVYTGFMSWAVFMPRESLFDPYRNVVWMLVVASILLRGYSTRSRI